jgi:DNA-binding NtrC family response regulator
MNSFAFALTSCTKGAGAAMASKRKTGCKPKKRSWSSTESGRPEVDRAAHVLIIDDNPVQLSIREAVLRDAGFLVSIATTGPSALALLRAAHLPFHAIVTDHVMPKVSGADFVRELRNVDTAIPVLVVTGMPDIESDYEGLNVTVRQKPLPPLELIELLEKATQPN